MFFEHKGLRSHCGDALLAGLMGTPAHEDTVRKAAEHSHHPGGVIRLRPAPGIAVRSIQMWVQSAFDPPSIAVV